MSFCQSRRCLPLVPDNVLYLALLERCWPDATLGPLASFAMAIKRNKSFSGGTIRLMSTESPKFHNNIGSACRQQLKQARPFLLLHGSTQELRIDRHNNGAQRHEHGPERRMQENTPLEEHTGGKGYGEDVVAGRPP